MTTIEVTIAPMIVQPASPTGVYLKPPSSTSRSNDCHQRWPSTRRWAPAASIAVTSARRIAALFLGGNRHVIRHAAPERAVSSVDQGEERQREKGDHRDDDEHRQVRRDDHLVEPGLLERASVVRERQRRGRVLRRGRLTAYRQGDVGGDVRRQQRAIGHLVLGGEVGADLGEDRRQLGRVGGFRIAAAASAGDAGERLRVVLRGAKADRVDACARARKGGERFRTGGLATHVRAVGEEDDRRSPEPLVGDGLGRLDERVVDVRALRRLGRLGDGLGELFAVRRERPRASCRRARTRRRTRACPAFAPSRTLGPPPSHLRAARPSCCSRRRSAGRRLSRRLREARPRGR